MDKLKEWFLEKKRDLPWREGKTPYRVWISEVMLQQTRVVVVIPYFHRWMEKFPTLQTLAKAPLEEVIKTWEGLGYYSRARNLHKAAQQMVTHYHGEIPSDPEKLIELPGFGPYTRGAVLSFAFHKRAVAVDGNVIRVLSRYFACRENTSKRKHYESLTEKVLPREDPWIFMEALIELGATVCQKKARCLECHLQTHCRAFLEGKANQFPVKKKSFQTIYLKRQVAIVFHGEDVVVRQEKEAKIMQGLYEFPYTDLKSSLNLGLPLKKMRRLPLVKHGFTRYNVTLYPSVYWTDIKKEVDGCEWRKWTDLDRIPFSSGHRHILEMLKDEDFTHGKF